jgi:hypothetical protein
MSPARLALLLVLAAFPLFGQDTEAQRVLADYATLQLYYPRPEGSPAERSVLRYVEARLEQLGLAFRRFDFQESDLDHSFSSCLSVTIQGEREDRLLLAVPLNHPLEASRDLDGSINIALALQLLERMQRSKPPISVEVLFLGAEFGEGPGYPMGSRLFLRSFTPAYRVMALYLNLRTIPTRVHIRPGGRGVEAPYWLIDRTTRALRAADLFFLLRGNETQIFRIGLTGERTIIEPFLAADYPAVSLEGEYAGLPAGGEQAWAASFLRFFDEFLASFRGGIPETWDRHYLFFQVRNFYFRISEQLYLGLLIAVLSAVLAYSLVATRRLRRYLRLLGRDFWVLPLYLLFVFLLLFLSTLALEGIQRLRNMSELWVSLPLPFLAFKLAVSLLIFFAALPLLRRLHISRRGSFYSAAALLFLLLDIVVVAVINISFTYYFLWAFLLGLLFSASPWRPLKLLAFLASPYWLVKTVLELFSLPVLRFTRFVLLSPLWGNMLLAVVLLPFILMFIRLRMVVPLFRISNRRTRQVAGASVFAAVLLGLAVFFLSYSPYSRARPQPVTALYTFDQGGSLRRLRLESPAPLGRLSVWDGRQFIAVDTRRRTWQENLPPAEQLLVTQVVSQAFLDRRNITLDLQPRGEPVRVRLAVSSAEEFVLYDASFPWERDPGGRRYALLIGANPPLPLAVQVTLPQGRSFSVEITLEYDQPPLEYRVYAPGKSVRAHLSYRTHLELKT